MKNTRQVALQVLMLVVSKGRALDEALQQCLPEGEDKAQPFVQALCYGVVRQYYCLEALTKKLLNKGFKAKDQDALLVIYIGLYQLLEMRVKEHAAVSETVQLAKKLNKRWLPPVVNGVLRRFLRERNDLLASLSEAEKLSHPLWLQKKIKAAYPEKWQTILQENNCLPPMHLRVNLQRCTVPEYLTLLEQSQIEASEVKGLPAAVTLAKPVPVSKLPKFSEGWVSVQDLAAQQVVGLMDLKPGLTVLDACAAPGGKTAAILEAEPTLEMLAVDKDPKRLDMVAENLQRMQLKAKLLAADLTQPKALGEQQFDRILLDAPCSATGVIRRHPDIKLLRWEEDIPVLAEQQLALLSSLWPRLKLGGRLIYATCSVLPEENDAVIKRFLALTPQAKCVPLSLSHGSATEYGWQCLPAAGSVDGFFYSEICYVY